MKETVVYRHLALPVPVFDHIKDVQRRETARTGVHWTLNQTVARIVRDHKEQLKEGRGGRQHEQQASNIAAILR